MQNTTRNAAQREGARPAPQNDAQKIAEHMARLNIAGSPRNYELLYEAEAAWWLPVEFVIDEASSEHLRAQVRGVGITTPPPALKAANLHSVQVTHGPRGYDATAVLDL